MTWGWWHAARVQDADFWIDEYLTYLKVERGLGIATVQAYATDLTRFVRYLEKERSSVNGADAIALCLHVDGYAFG